MRSSRRTSRTSSRAAKPELISARLSQSTTRARLSQPTTRAARALIGAQLVRDDGPVRRSGRIVEVEAYIGEDDQASHARFGRTARNGVMYGPPGRAYVYLVYGLHDCLNVVTEPEGRPAAVLIRAVEPEEGIEAMRAAHLERELARRRMAVDATERERIAARLASEPATRMASGPGRVASAFGLDRTHTGFDLTDPDSPIRIEMPAEGRSHGRTHGRSDRRSGRRSIITGPRIGVGYASEPWRSMPWRFALHGSTAVSAPRPDPADTADAADRIPDVVRTPIRKAR